MVHPTVSGLHDNLAVPGEVGGWIKYLIVTAASIVVANITALIAAFNGKNPIIWGTVAMCVSVLALILLI